MASQPSSRPYRKGKKMSKTEAAKAQFKNRYREGMKLIDSHKVKSGCERCGMKDIRVLDFHHKNGRGDNEVTVSRLAVSSVKRILEELEKCQVLCANCHRIAHYEEATEQALFGELSSEYLVGGSP